MSRLLIGALVVSSLLVAPASAGARHEPAARGAAAYPNAIVVLGDGAAAGHSTNPAHPLFDVPDNSWATGANPAVDSVYSRILALNPAVRGHGVNLATDDLSPAGFAAQMHRAIALSPKPELVIVQLGDRAFASCDGRDDAHYADFGAEWTTILQTLTTGLPHAQIFLVSPWGGSYGSSWGSFDSYAKYLAGLDVGLRLQHAGKHPCQFADSPSGRIVPARVAYMKQTWAGYEAQKTAACARFPQCHYDRGIAGRIAVTAADIAPGGGYPSVQGEAQLAAAEWAALSSFLGGP
jgi:hypothetical protein